MTTWSMVSRWLIRLMWNHCRLGSIGWWNHLFLAPEIDCGRVSPPALADGIACIFDRLKLLLKLLLNNFCG
jgi:hypothetical protein